MKFKKYLSLNYESAIRAKSTYRPWGKPHNSTMANICCNVLVCMCLNVCFKHSVINVIGMIGAIVFIVMGFIYLFAFFMTHWYYVSAIHFLNNYNSSNHKEK